MRESVIFYRSFFEAINSIGKPNDNQALSEKLAAYDNIFNYIFSNVEPPVQEGVGYAIFLMAKPQIDKNMARYENGKNGGRPQKNGVKKTRVPQKNDSGCLAGEKPNQNQDKTKRQPNVNVNEMKERINLSVYTKEKKDIDAGFIDEQFKIPFVRWLNYKKARKEPYANADSLMTCYTKLLNQSAHDPLVADAMIEAAIGNNYQGFFPLKNTPFKTQGEAKEWLKY